MKRAQCASKIFYIVCFISLLCFTFGNEILYAQKTWENVNAFFKQQDLVIVYGTNNSTTIDFLRKQAYIISDGYKQNRNITIGVTSDKEISFNDIKSKSIILLGTSSSNIILKKLLSKLPIEFTENGYLWGGKVYAEKDKVLRFIFPNPFNPEKLLAVYTGNDDKELRSRYFDLMVGGLGGEYAITQKTFVIRSGFYKKQENKWSYDCEFDWDNEKNIAKFFDTIRLHETKHYKLHYYADSPIAPYIEYIGKLKEKEYPKHFALLKQPVKDYKITIYYFKSVAQMDEVGMFGNDPSTLLITFIGASFNDIPGWGTHEDMHPLSYHMLGQISGGGDISSPLLGEGVACLVHGDGVWHGKPIDYWTVKFLTEGNLPTLKEFLAGYRIIDWLITYPTSGHFAKFLLDTYGVDKFITLWNSADLKHDIPEILEISIEELEKQWHKSIHLLENRYKKMLEAGRFFELGLVYYWDEDFPAAEKKFLNSLKIEPENPEIHYFLARNYFNQGSYEKAEKYFKSCLELEKHPMYEWMTPHAHLNLGRIADLRKEREKAVKYYKKIMEFPNEKKSHQHAEKGIEHPLKEDDIALDYDLDYPWHFGIHIPAFRPELMGGTVSYFGFSLKHIKNGEYKKALKYFDRALLEDKENPDILYFLGVTQFNLGKYKEALKTFDQIIKSKRKPYREYIPTLIHLYKSRIYDKLKDHKSALSEYKVVLSMPDWRDAHAEVKKYIKE